jgi:alkaline phosphatase D
MPSKLSRRGFVQHAAASSALLLAPFGRLAAQVRFSAYPFELGVASGDPTADGFVIWTRLAPEPLEPEQLGRVTFEVDWEVAEDASFARIVARGSNFAPAHLAHSVHAEVTGLQPGSEYFYRFRLGRYESQVGRAITLPAADSSPERIRFDFCCCAHYEQGFFSAYRYMAQDKPDLIFELGDYIYEDSWGDRRVRLFHKTEALTLDDYRGRYAQYRTDPDLRAAHEACPWVVSWDDHEVDNDYAGLTGEHEACGGERVRQTFPGRRAAAYQAWFEHMPVRPSRLLTAGGVRISGNLDWGRLARFHVLDTRHFRSPQACGNAPTFARCDTERGRKVLFSGAGGGSFADPNDPACKVELNDPGRTMLGAEQEKWLDGSLAASHARWNVLAQGVLFAGLTEGTPAAPRIFTDAWSGYPAAKRRLIESLARHKAVNPVVLSGDIHSFFANEVENTRGTPVAVELVTSSVATNNSDKSQLLAQNPHIKFHDGRHSGYIRCEATPERLRADFVAIDDIRDSRSAREVLATYEVNSGAPRLVRVGG